MGVLYSIMSTMLGIQGENQSLTLFSQRSELKGIKNISMIKLGILGKGRIKTRFDYRHIR